MSEQILCQRIDDIKPSVHACWLYQDECEEIGFLADYIRQGFSQNQKVVIVYDQSAPERLFRCLEERGIQAAEAIQRQQLVFASYQQAYLPNGKFDPDDIIQRVTALVEQALREGYTAVRSVSDMNWLHRSPLDSIRVAEYENKFNQLIQQLPMVTLCQYDQRLYKPGFLLQIFQTHPSILVGNEVHDNPYFIPTSPDEPAANAQASLDRWMAFLMAKNHAGKRLQESEKKFRLLYEDAPLAYQSLDVNGCIIDVNPAWCALLGYSREEVLGMWLGELMIPEHKELFRSRFKMFKNRGVVQDAEFELIRKDGAHIILSANGQIGRDEQGNFRQTHCILTDVTLKKKAEKELREGEQLYKALFEQNPEIVLLLHPETGQIVQANQAACAFFGYSANELTQMKLSQVSELASEQDHAALLSQAGGQSGFLAAKGRLANGECRDLELYSGPIEVNGQKCFYAIIHDVTEKKAAETENRRVNAALRQRVLALSQPLAELGSLQFEDLFDLDDIQAIQDAFSSASGVASIITRTDGRPITRPSNFCHLCFGIIRKTPEGLKNCMRSDKIIGSPRADGPTIQPCLSGGLMDAGASIMVGDHHIANWLIGQVLDTDADIDQMVGYAKEIGVDETEYRSALTSVRKMPAEQFRQVSQALFLISAQLSKLAVQNIQQARVISDREQAQIRLARVNRLYAVVSHISQAAVKVRSEQELYESACQILIREGKFKMAWVGLLDESSQIIRPVFRAGEELGYLNSVTIRADDVPEGRGPAGTVIREKRVVCCNDTNTDPRLEAFREPALQRGYQSIASFPLLIGERVIGSMTVYSAERNFFDDRENTLLQEISDTMSFALESIEKEKRRRKAELALLESEEKYRRLFSSGNDAVFVFPVLDGQRPGHFSEVNPVACEQLGYTEEELLQLSVMDIARLVNEDNFEERVQKLWSEKGLLTEIVHIAKDGRQIPVEVNSRSFEYHGQRYVQSIARDITERKQAEQRIQNQIERLSALRAIDSAINMKHQLSTVMDVILSKVVEQIHVSAAAILLYQPDTNQLQFASGQGFSTRLIETTVIPIGEAPDAVESGPGKTINITHLPRLDAHVRQAVLTAEGFAAYDYLPVIAKDKVLGILEIYHHGPLEAQAEWIDYLETLAGQAAIAIEDARLVDTLIKSNQELIQAYDETISGWSRALDLRDRETEGHSQRVTEMTLQLARSMGFPEADLIHIRRGAMLHDIGKVGIPDRILLKPDPLTPEEWQMMKRHPQYAVNLLSPITFLRPALAIPHYHHEKWDGTGYPGGLRGEEIPLSARIFAVVDVWDALLSDRPYRRGWPAEEVLAYIEEQTGKHFDPQVVSAFIACLRGDFEDRQPV